jgi:hypothetical protein
LVSRSEPTQDCIPSQSEGHSRAITQSKSLVHCLAIPTSGKPNPQGGWQKHFEEIE